MSADRAVRRDDAMLSRCRSLLILPALCTRSIPAVYCSHSSAFRNGLYPSKLRDWFRAVEEQQALLNGQTDGTSNGDLPATAGASSATNKAGTNTLTHKNFITCTDPFTCNSIAAVLLCDVPASCSNRSRHAARLCALRRRKCIRSVATHTATVATKTAFTSQGPSRGPSSTSTCSLQF